MTKFYPVVLALAGTLVAACDEKDILPSQPPVKQPVVEQNVITFLTGEASVDEGEAQGTDVQLRLNKPTTQPARVEVHVSSEKRQYATHFQTEPAVQNGLLILDIPAGSTEVTFRVNTIDNDLPEEAAELVFRMIAVSPNLSYGNVREFRLWISDDDQTTGARKYETFAGSWRTSRTYEYNEAGLVTKIFWEQHTPNLSRGSYTYHYQGDKLQRVTEETGRETRYLYQAGRIVRSEVFQLGSMVQFNVYAYDEYGNIGEVTAHHRQPNGTFVRSTITIYLYFEDGNLYKYLVYAPDVENDDFTLLSTHTYENYMNRANPFPIEIVPNMNAQPNLPGRYTVETQGQTLVYNFTYAFDSNGRPTSRTTSGSNSNEFTRYSYF